MRLRGNTHQRFHIAVIKRIHGGLIAIGHAGFEFSDRVRCALRMGVIGRKYKYLWPYVLNNPADRLAREWRKPKVFSDGL